MKVLPILEEMQSGGMPASRSRFEELSAFVAGEMREIQSRISHRYFEGRPFNPNSSPQVRTLMRRRGLEGAKRTATTREISTSKKSIEHHRAVDPAISDIFDWRERSKVKTTYCDPILEIADEQAAAVDLSNPDIFMVRGKIKPVSIPTRRLAMTDPSLLNQPSRTELGRRVRGCYVTTGEEVFGAWDYSSQEMRVAADETGDELLIRVFSLCRFCGADLRYPHLLPATCTRSENGHHESDDPHSITPMRYWIH